MIDIALVWNPILSAADLSLNGSDLLVEDGLETAILISLFTDRRASKDDILPDGSADRRGWWGDAFAVTEGDLIGSRLWLLDRAKITPETLRLARDYAQESLAWLTRDGIAKSVDVTAERLDVSRVALKIVVTRPEGGAGTYDYVWSAL